MVRSHNSYKILRKKTASGASAVKTEGRRWGGVGEMVGRRRRGGREKKEIKKLLFAKSSEIFSVHLSAITWLLPLLLLLLSGSGFFLGSGGSQRAVRCSDLHPVSQTLEELPNLQLPPQLSASFLTRPLCCLSLTCCSPSTAAPPPLQEENTLPVPASSTRGQCWRRGRM